VFGRAGIGVAAAVFALLLIPAFASAAVPVTIQSDEQDAECTVDCSLRDAVIIASRSNDVVQVPSGTYALSLGQLEVGNVTIQGAGADTTVIQAGTDERALMITSTATISGVRISGGNPEGTNSGGGIEMGNNQIPLTLRLNDSVVAGNSVVQSSQGFGGGIAVNGLATLLMTNSTVSGNRVLGGDGPGVGGGIYVDTGGRAELRNSTVSGNTAEESFGAGLGGGIGLNDSSTLVLENVTIASNTAASGGGIAEDLDFFSPVPPTMTIDDTIVAGNAGTECSGAFVHGGNYNLSSDATCAFTATGDKPNTDPQIGPLQVNTGIGRTATHALPLSSPAVNAGDPPTCKPTDQRGAPRTAGACDIGAFEYANPRLTVTTGIVNDSGGTASALNFRVTRNGADVAGSPASGSGQFALEAGTFNVSAALTGYTVTVGGDCTPGGDVALGENEAKACTITANDNAVLGQSQLPPPVIRKRVNMIPVRGTIRVKRPGQKRFRVLAGDGAQLPVGTVVNALNGRVTIVAASDARGGTDTGVFYGGIFRITQTRGKKPTTILALTEKLTCPRAGSAIAAAKKKKRRLWGDGSGKFRTKGKHSAATVVGTKWLVEDRCRSTLTRVVRGRVKVRDFAKKKTITVRRGKRYIARAG
jgi:hypothetical protein